MVVALYVDLAMGPYPSLLGGDACWGRSVRDGSQPGLLTPDRDAREYEGPSPVVAHPPCGPWGRFWWNYKGGEGDKDCGIRAAQQVREWGGVLEHPSESGLWDAVGMPRPEEGEDHHGGFTLRVNQCDWGHPARKPTWLYVFGLRGDVPTPPPEGKPTMVMVRLLRNGNDLPEVPKSIRHLTPEPFAKWLIELASRCGKP
jgi:hypothetical protein